MFLEKAREYISINKFFIIFRKEGLIIDIKKNIKVKGKYINRLFYALIEYLV